MEKQFQQQTATRAVGGLMLFCERQLRIHNFRKAITGLIILSCLCFDVVQAQVSIPSYGTAVTEDFNTLASAGTSMSVPTGWAFNETLVNANTSYTAGTGSSNTGDTYSFGAAANAERAFGGLQSGSLLPTLGGSFTNNTGGTITSLAIAYIGEQWRLGTLARVDRLDFQYSTDATSLTTGTWTDVDALDFTAPVTTGVVGLLDGNAAANQTAVSSTITSLSISNGNTFWIRWNDFNGSGADDGLAVDNFSITACAPVTCPSNFSVCSIDLPFALTGGNPPGGTYSGTGVTAGIFDPDAAGVGSHLITYTTTGDCAGSCTFTITVNPIPVLTGTAPLPVCELDAPFLLNVISPPGGFYFGPGVTNNIFSPAVAGPGGHPITYTFTNAFNCTWSYTFLLTVTAAASCAPTMEWVLLPAGEENGSCLSESDCCEDILCYGLQFTPGTSGNLLDYTTGFVTNCIDGNPPVISNSSCTMDDNSDLLNACITDDMILFNSSGNDGALPVFQGVPVILHQVCFSIPVGESLLIEEDVITNLTASIAITPNTILVEFPAYEDFSITRTPPVDPMDGSDLVQCVEDADPPQTPVVLDQCGEPITPMLTSVVDNPDPLDCEGTRIYTYTYVDCDDESVNWTFTYTIDHTILPSEVGGPVATSANVNGIDNAGPPMLPYVLDVCGQELQPFLISIMDTPNPIVCSGTRVYNYSWMDCSGLTFFWSFTYTINNVPIMDCPANTTVCITDAPFLLTGATPIGGTYTGNGVVMGVFNPALAGLGPHPITYTYTNPQGCSNTCTFQIFVAPSPTATCRPNASVCSFEDPFEITGCNPPGGVFSGAGISDDMFDPGEAGLGMHTITYTVTNVNGCTSSCSFVFNVTQCPGPPVIEIIPLDPCDETSDYGTCNFEGNCCDNILCFAIRYTPGYSGMLTSYTTGFFIDCVGGNSPIVYNQSCVMNDNSFEAPMCEGGVILFNSSGNEGSLPITVGVPVILHRLCFVVPPGTSLDIIEDIITDLTASIDLTGGDQIDEFPTYTPVTVTRTYPEVPEDESSIVACPDYALPPMPPSGIVDQCCDPVLPVLTSVVDTPDPLTCEGTRVYTYTYPGCGGASSVWHYTYFIEPVDFVLPMNGNGMVACPDLATPGAVMLPLVLSNCGDPLSPVSGPFENYNETDTYVDCEGTISFTWIYQDCDLDLHPWTFTYTIERNDFTVPMNGNGMVSCPIQANPMNVILPSVFSDCDEPLSPVGGPIPNYSDTDTYDGCEGTISFTWIYQDCEGNTHPWTFIYTIERNDFIVPPGTGTIIACPSQINLFTVLLPTVTSDCGEPLNPAGPVLDQFETDTYNGCEGTVSFTWTYTDCELNSHTWTYTYTIERNDFMVPPGQGGIVSCPQQAVPFTVNVPQVFSDCGEPLIPSPVIPNFFNTDTYNGCEGTISFTWIFTDCEMNTHPWTYTYTIERNDFMVPPNNGGIVFCPAQAVPFTVNVPQVFSDCGEPLIPSAPIPNYLGTDTYNGCEGTISFTWIFTDCEMNTHPWTFIYTIERNDFMVPPGQGGMVSCPQQAVPFTVNVPPVISDCGEPLMPGPAIQNYFNTDTYNGCEGTISFTWIFTDCEMNSHPWTYTYTIERNDFMVPPGQGGMISCPQQAVPFTVNVPPVFSDCGEPLMPGPAIPNYFNTDTYNGCEGTISFSWIFTDCEMNSHPWTYTYTIERNDFMVPPGQGGMVSCPQQAVPFTVNVPPVFSDCGEPLMPSPAIPNYFNTDTYNGCEGTISFSWIFTDCEMNTHPWTYTYTIERNDFMVPPDDGVIVACPAQVNPALIIPPIVFSNCGELIIPTGPIPNQFGTDTYNGCEGTGSFTWTYQDCEPNTHYWTYTFTIERNDFMVPPDGSGVVSCPIQANPLNAMLPNVFSNCGETLFPGPPTENYFDIDSYDGCEGTISFTWFYMDCEGNSHPWTYTFTIERNDFFVPPGGGAIISCASQINLSLILPIPLNSDCGELVFPVGPELNQFGTDTYDGCEGTISYTWTYTDCELNSHTWTYTYTVIRLDFTVPMDGNGTVSCPIQANPMNVILPSVFSNCGEPLLPVSGPVSNYNDTDTYDGCEGTVSFTWFYTDCADHTHPWTYTFTVERNDFMTPPNNGEIVPCPALATPATVIVPMVVSNCGEPLSPIFSAVQNYNQTDTYAGCEGTISYTWIYQDCEGNIQAWTYTYTIERNDFVIAPNDGGFVPCPALATPATVILPIVFSNCLEPLSPVSGPITDYNETDTYTNCEGTISYTWIYQDCEGNTQPWTYTYTIERSDFMVPPDNGGMVSCPAQATAAAVMLPNVFSHCGEPLMPGLPIQDYFETDTYVDCEGTISYTWIYMDCEGNSHPWTYTYTIERNDFTVPMDDGVVIPFAIFANPIFVTLPQVLSDCDEVLTPSAPIQNYYGTDTYVDCEGTISFTWFYTDCVGNSHPWTFTFTIVRPDFVLPQQNAVEPVPCVALAIAANVVLPNVFDADGVPLTPGPALQNYFGTDTYNGIEGTISFTWLFMDCAMHVHAWTHTFSVTCLSPTEIGGPAPTSSTIECYLDAEPPALPVIVDGCGLPLTPSGPVIGGTNTGNCSGTITYTYTYLNCEGTTYPWVYTYNVSCASIQLKVWLEGAYSTAGDSMQTTMNQQHKLPGQLNGPFIFDAPPGQPYTTAPWNYAGNPGTQFGDGGGQTPYPSSVVDWVLVIVRQNGILPANNIWSCAGWVHENGDVTFPENCPPPAFNTTDLYYVVVQHRNHLGILSPLEMDMPCGTAVVDWDFRTSNSYVEPFRFGQKQVEPGVWAMFAGNGEQVMSIGAINSFDRTTWKVWQGFNGYNLGDYIMDGFTDSFDETIWKNNQNRTSAVTFY